MFVLNKKNPVILYKVHLDNFSRYYTLLVYFYNCDSTAINSFVRVTVIDPKVSLQHLILYVNIY